jgi:hypothetical protein
MRSKKTWPEKVTTETMAQTDIYSFFCKAATTLNITSDMMVISTVNLQYVS